MGANDTTIDDAPAASASAHDRRAAAVDAPALSAAHDTTARAVTINRPAAELFAYFRDFSNLPRFMENVVRIDMRDRDSSHWVVKSLGGGTVEWDARVTEERPDALIAWASEPGADIANAGRIEFREAGARGTVVTATIAYDPPAGGLGKLVAKLFQREPAIQARRDLRRFKQLMETGEIATASRSRREFEERG